MTNLDFITGWLATGGDLPSNRRAAAAELAEWRERGVTHVMDTRIEWSDEDLVAELAPDIHYLHNGVDDAGQQMPDEWFDRGLAFARRAYETPNSRLYVHCHMGINRGPSMTYALMLANCWDPVNAAHAIRLARPIAHIGYAEDALDWHHRRCDASPRKRRSDRARLQAWREAFPHDLVRTIRDAGEDLSI